MEKTIGVRMPGWLIDIIDEAAERQVSTRSQVVRQAILAWGAEEKRRNGRSSSQSTKTGRRRPRRDAPSRA